MESNIIINQVIILFLIMGVGFGARKKGIIDEEAGKKLSSLLLMVISPAMIVSSFQLKYSKEMFINIIFVLIFAILAHVFTLFLGLVLYRKYPDNTRNVLKFATVFSNCGFMGFPLLQSLYGKAGIFYGSIYVAVFNLFVWTIGVMIFSKKRDDHSIKKAMLNPGIISVLIGMLIFFFSINLPEPVSKALDMVGAMNSPLAMLIIGSILAGVDFKKFLSGFPLYYGTAVRNVFLPLFTAAVLKSIGITGVVLGVSVAVMAMPAAANTAIFAEIYDGDSLFASKVVAFSTLLSIITIPLIVMLL